MTPQHTAPTVTAYEPPMWQQHTDFDFLIIVDAEFATETFAKFAGCMLYAQRGAVTAPTEGSARGVRAHGYRSGAVRPHSRETADDRRERKHRRDMKSLWGPRGGGR
jgi:hypothetical protein